MKVFKSRVAIYAIISVFMGGVAWATTPAADYKTVTSKAYVDSLISDSDISSHTVNGAALSNEASYFYGTSSTAANQEIKDVTVTGLATPGANDHPIIVVQPEHTSMLALISGTPEFKLRLNSDAAADAKPIYVNGAPLDIKSQDSVWNENYPSAFVFDGTNWVFLGAGYNINTVIESYKVNGAPLKKAGTFYGTSSTVATTGAKTVTINGFQNAGYTPVDGQIIVVSPTITSTYDGAHTLSVNNSTAVPIYYNGAAVTDAATAAMVWTANVPATFVYESSGGGKWVFAGHGVDSMIPAGTSGNVVTYSGTAGAPGSRGVLNDLNLNESKAVNAYSVTFDGTTNNWPTDDATKLVSGTGLADALRLKQNKIPAGTADDVVTYSGTAGTTNSRGVLSTLDTTQNGLIGGYNDTFSGNTSTWTTDPQTGIETGSWAASEASKLVSVQAFAKGLAKKQNQIAATSSNLTFDNTNPQSARAKSAGYSVVTTSGVAGSTGQIGVANEALYVTSNNETTLVNGEWIPNMYALDRMLNSATSGTINGASVGSASAYFYDNAGGGTASSCAKTASIPSIGTLSAGQVIVVKPATTSTCSGAHTLALNGAQTGQTILYDGATISNANIAARVWTAGRPSTFVYDGTNWLFMGDTIPTTMSVTNGRNGASTVGQVLSAKNLKATVHGLNLQSVSGTDATTLSLDTSQIGAITTSDTIIGAFGKLQGQINSLGSDLSYISGLTGSTINGIDLKELVRNGGGDAVFYDGECSYDDKNICTFKIPYLDAESSIKNGMLIVLRPKGDIKSEEKALETDGLLLSTVVADKSYTFQVLYNGDTVNDVATASIVLSPDYPSIFVFDTNAGKGGAWLFAGSGIDLATHTVNGAPLSNTSSYYYGTGTASATGITVTIPSIASTANTLPGTGQIIVVQPTDTLGYACNTTNWKLGLNDFNSAPVLYFSDMLGCDPTQQTDAKDTVWSDHYPSMFVFDGTYWVFLGHGVDKDTTYAALTSGASGAWSGPAGTGTGPGVISPQTLKNSIHRVNLTANSGTTAWAATNSRMATSDTMLGALGKAQGQIDNRQTLVPATGTYKTLSGTTWTSTSISDYDAAGVKGTSLPTKTGTEGNLGERMIVDSGTDTTGWATAKLANAIPSMSKISAITASMQSQKVCYEYKPGTGANPTDADCWLWRLP